MGKKDCEKSARAANITAADRAMIVELVENFWQIVENKQTDAVTTTQKNLAWQQISTHYNSINPVRRTADQLRQAYENIKKRAKKAAASDRTEHFKTGGGNYKPALDALDAKVIQLLGNRATPLRNSYDSQSELYAIHDATVSQGLLSTNAAPATVSQGLLSTDAAPATVSQGLLSTDAAPATVSQGFLLINQSATTAVQVCSDIPHRSSANSSAGPTRKRRYQLPRPAAAKVAATATISEAAQSQKEYYEAKLLMAKERHAAKMKLIHLKEELLKKKLEE